MLSVLVALIIKFPSEVDVANLAQPGPLRSPSMIFCQNCVHEEAAGISQHEVVHFPHMACQVPFGAKLFLTDCTNISGLPPTPWLLLLGTATGSKMSINVVLLLKLFTTKLAYIAGLIMYISYMV